jgi:ornithine--oxo-acid transaminase
MEKGVLAKETHEIVVRFAPPLIIKKKEIDWAIQQLKSVISSL